jgi:hypothetical protein
MFYPSYGDTYPTYNGAVGMTFEQGGIGAGREVLMEMVRRLPSKRLSCKSCFNGG